MNAYAISLSKYVNTGIFALFTLLSYLGFAVRSRRLSRAVEIIQRLLLAAFLINANLTVAWFIWGSRGRDLCLLCAMEILFLLAFMTLYRIVHEMANMFLFNNICMLLSVGFVTISRIALYGTSDSTMYKANEPFKQFVMASAGLLIMLIIPFFRRIFDSMRHLGIIFGVIGIIALSGVLFLSSATNGALITSTIAGFTFQPSEFIKILFILMIAGMLSGEVTLEKALLVSFLAAIHVGILVKSTDLGSALIYFVVYLMMIFLATGRWSIVVCGAALCTIGSVVCYRLFYHVQVRVAIWRDPFSDTRNLGYQIAQSLFAISYGGPWGAGLTQGSPDSIPNVETDFIFSVIAEEMGLIFSVCLLLLCLNSFIRILLLSASYSNRFFQLYTYGAAVCYIFQTFLTVGGETKFIPLTGVTLPLVSYGGSSILSTLTMLGIVEMIYILHEERTARFIERYEREHSDSGPDGSYAYPDGFNGSGSDGGYAYSDGFNGSGPDGGYAYPEGFSGGGPDGQSGGGYGFETNADGMNGDFPYGGVSEDSIFDENIPGVGEEDVEDDGQADGYGFYHPGEMKR